jgi:HEAT repeat protein
VPPGSIDVRIFEPDGPTDVLRRGIADPVKSVRERAIAAAYGMNVVELVRDDLLSRLDDPDMDVRQYAIVALGVLVDSESRRRLVEKLEHGTKEETTSAISALARRRDGLARVLEMVTDGRAWVRDEVLHAIAEVATLMADEQVEKLRQTIQDAALPRVIARHLERARDGGREYGSDGGLFVLRPDPKPHGNA